MAAPKRNYLDESPAGVRSGKSGRTMRVKQVSAGMPISSFSFPNRTPAPSTAPMVGMARPSGSPPKFRAGLDSPGYYDQRQSSLEPVRPGSGRVNPGVRGGIMPDPFRGPVDSPYPGYGYQGTDWPIGYETPGTTTTTGRPNPGTWSQPYRDTPIIQSPNQYFGGVRTRPSANFNNDLAPYVVQPPAAKYAPVPTFSVPAMQEPSGSFTSLPNSYLSPSESFQTMDPGFYGAQVPGVWTDGYVDGGFGNTYNQGVLGTTVNPAGVAGQQQSYGMNALSRLLQQLLAMYGR